MNEKMGMHEQGRGAWAFNAARMLTRLDGGLQESRIMIAEEHAVHGGFDVRKVGGLLGFMVRAQESETLAAIEALVVVLHAVNDSMRTDDEERKVRIKEIVRQLKLCGMESVRSTYDSIGRYANMEELVEGEDEDSSDEDDTGV